MKKIFCFFVFIFCTCLSDEYYSSYGEPLRFKEGFNFRFNPNENLSRKELLAIGGVVTFMSLIGYLIYNKKIVLKEENFNEPETNFMKDYPYE